MPVEILRLDLLIPGGIRPRPQFETGDIGVQAIPGNGGKPQHPVLVLARILSIGHLVPHRAILNRTSLLLKTCRSRSTRQRVQLSGERDGKPRWEDGPWYRAEGDVGQAAKSRY